MTTQVSAVSAKNIVSLSGAQSRAEACDQDFNDMLSRKIDPPASKTETAREPSGKDQSAASEDTTETTGDASGTTDSAAQAQQTAAVVDPLLASLQSLSTNLPVAVAQPTTTAADTQQGASSPASLLSGVDQALTAQNIGVTAEDTMSVATDKTDPQAMLTVGNDLPGKNAGAANPASFSSQLLNKLGSDTDTDTPVDGTSLHFDLSAMGSAAGKNEAAKAGVASQTTPSMYQVDEPVGSGQWGGVVAQRVSMMLGRQDQQIQMQLNPPNLGPMEVKLTVAGEQASVVFSSQHAAVREALSAATAQLSMALADQGLTVVDVKVSSDALSQHQQDTAQQSFSDAQQGRSGYGGAAYTTGNSAEAAVESIELTNVRLPVSRSGVSLYV